MNEQKLEEVTMTLDGKPVNLSQLNEKREEKKEVKTEKIVEVTPNNYRTLHRLDE